MIEDEDQKSLFHEIDEIDPDILFTKDGFNMGSTNDVRPHGAIYKKRSKYGGGGKPKGTLNERTKRIKHYMLNILEGIPPEQDILDLMAMKPYERQRIKLEIAEFILPKLQRAELKTDIDGEKTIVVMLPEHLQRIDRSINAIEAEIESEAETKSLPVSDQDNEKDLSNDQSGD